jgi:glucose/arabinose dehydrogenase
MPHSKTILLLLLMFGLQNWYGPQTQTPAGPIQIADGRNLKSRVLVRARGNQGGEQFRLQINGKVAAVFTTTAEFQTFVFQSSEKLTTSKIRVEFFNDARDSVIGLDNKLIVDYIEVDGVRIETENPDVLSTGSWQEGDGIQPGFQRGSRLDAEGYFEFPVGVFQPGEVRLLDSVYSASESDGFINVLILRENGSSGAVSVEYATADSTATAGEDYETRLGMVSWLDGESGAKTVSIPILEDTDIEGDEQFSFAIDNLVGEAVLLAPRTATITIDDNDSVLSQGDGLLGEYFDNIDLTNRSLFRTDATVDFDWGSGAPDPGMGSDTFSVRWTGQVEPRYSETYTFQTLSDDGIRLWVDENLIINQWNDHSATYHAGTIALEAGVLYNIRIEYYDNGGNAVARLNWSSPSQALEVVPQSQLYAADDPAPDPGQIVAQTILSGLTAPTSLDWSPDGTNMYVTEQRGLVRVVHNGVRETTPFIDIRAIVNGIRDRGLLDIAVHPDFPNPPYVYLLFTYDPPEVFQNTGFAGPDGRGNRAGRLLRVTADANNDYKTAVAGSEVVVLGSNSTWENFNGFANSTNDFNEPPAGINPDGTSLQDFIASDSESHTVGAIEFGIDGNLFVSIGDGCSYLAVDPRAVRVQDIDNLSGKVLRIDPITGDGISDNPYFVKGDAAANRSKVYQLGFRNPFRMSVDRDSGQLFIGDVGWSQWEEVNTGQPGSNFGWPYYEGGNGESLQTNGYQNLPEAQAFYASGQPVTAPIYGLNHGQTGINAIVLGDVYTGTTYPLEFLGDLFFNDLGQGIVRNINFDANGNLTLVQTFTTGAQIVVQIKQGPDGNLYYIDLNDGQVGRWVFQ